MENPRQNRITDARPLRRTLQPPTAEHLTQTQRLYEAFHAAIVNDAGIAHVPTGCLFTALLWVYLDLAGALVEQDNKWQSEADRLRSLGWSVAQAHEFKQEIADLYMIVAARNGITLEDGHDPLSTRADIISPKGVS